MALPMIIPVGHVGPHGPSQQNANEWYTRSWANYITSMIGVTLPLQSFRHSYVVTEGIEGLLGMPVLRDYVSSVYVKAQGDSAVIGYFEPNPEPIDQARKGRVSYCLC
ncbi:Sarcosine dehydrogenase, mitochondrial [Portunus trituberculatus]|uniref:Sarcosine dehydrogenase, mitochondrial n=1 Tax=Portunus trituberculatus TaxID=210409 RepID=A0A5B7HES5_PORTR|nr:Sarcosine dehydrogenase, mitochondrial [Portunus trituberculatus]